MPARLTPPPTDDRPFPTSLRSTVADPERHRGARSSGPAAVRRSSGARPVPYVGGTSAVAVVFRRRDRPRRDDRLPPFFTHRSFVAKRPLKIALAVLGTMSFQGSLIGWVADHRRHHRFSDRAGDPHSPWVEGGDAPAAGAASGTRTSGGASRTSRLRAPSTPPTCSRTPTSSSSTSCSSRAASPPSGCRSRSGTCSTGRSPVPSARSSGPASCGSVSPTTSRG